MVIITAKPIYSAEKIQLTYGGLEFSLSINSLETYAQTGVIDQQLSFYTQFLDEKSLSQLREWLQKPFKVNQVTISRLTNTALGVGLLEEIGQVISTHSGRNGLYPIRAALIAAAANPKGWTIIDVLREFPTQNIFIDGELLSQLQQELANLSDYRRAAVEAIVQEANRQNTTQPQANLAKLADLSQPGPYKVTKKTITIQKNAIRQTRRGLSDVYTFDVDVYLSENNPQPAPIIIISHGFGSLRENFLRLAEHLASYGYVAAVPEHIGSDLDYRERMLAGDVDSVISPLEYTERPLDITYLLDEFERLAASDSTWAQKLDLTKIGLIGDSLGGTTVLTLSGAPINQPRLEQECDPENISLDVSVLLQCRASYLPPTNFNLTDPRIKAVIAAHPVTSDIFGPESLSQITIPTLIVAGSADIVAPVVQEQIHPFVWLKTKEKYFVLLEPGTHFTSSQPPENTGELLPKFLVGNNRAQGSKFFRGLSVAFFGVYLKDNPEYSPYLTSAYNKSISNETLNINLIQSLTPTQLEIAYGDTPPTPVIPPTIVAQVEPRKEKILAEIAKTGVLKLAVRNDAAPFGYLDSDGKVTGYCVDLATGFAEYLTNKLKLDVPIEPVKLRSTLENRFQLVSNNDVHLECGPNTIRSDVKNVAFSEPFFVTGTQFLIPKNKASQINPNLSLEGVKVGVFKNSTTENFINKTYPLAEKIYLNESSTSSEIVQQLKSNQIDALANDGVLLITEAKEEKLSLDEYVLVPEIPLTCDYYGLIIPNDDPEWEKTVNNFVGLQMRNLMEANQLKDYLFNNLNYCFRPR